MSILDRALRVGEAKKFKSFETQRRADQRLRARARARVRRRAPRALRGACASGTWTASRSTTCCTSHSRSRARPASATLGQRHFDVQLIGGMVLHDGSIAEMKTGEGKTLTATLPVVLNALASRDEDGQAVQGKGVHLVTVNDYLARRDAMWMKPIYDLLGVTVGILQSGQERHRQERGLLPRRRLRHQLGVRLRLPARQPGRRDRAEGPARPRLRRSSTRSTTSSSTRRARR